jgi:hypothetical protein
MTSGWSPSLRSDGVAVLCDLFGNSDFMRATEWVRLIL